MEEQFLNNILLQANGVDLKGKGPKAYIVRNYHDLLGEKALKKVYDILLKEDKLEDADRAIFCMIRNYIRINYDPEASFIKYLKDAYTENVLYLFRNNKNLGIDLIHTHFLSYTQPSKTLPLEAKSIMQKFDLDTTMIALPNVLRGCFELIYNTLLYAGAPSNIVNAMMREIINGRAILRGNKDIENALVVLREYKEYLPHLMYSDIYEDMLAMGVEHDYEKAAVRVVDAAIRNNDFSWPSDEAERDVIINYFAYLCTCEDKRKENRKKIRNSKTISEEKKETISSINPIWFLDEWDLTHER